MKKQWKKYSLFLILIVAIGVAIYGHQQATGTSSSLETITIGYQKADPADISRQRGELVKKMKKKGYHVVFKQFQDGSALMTALKSGSIDYARLGDTPPITAQAAGTNLVYVAAGASKENGTGIVIPKNSSVKSIKDLKGKRVAYTKGTSSQYMLLSALKKAGMSADDIKWVNMDQSSASVAFSKGKVDAWSTWDPYTSQAQVKLKAKLLITGKGGLSYNRDFVVAMKSFASDHKEASQYLTEYMSDDMKWADQNHKALIKMLMKSLRLSREVVTKMVERRSYSMGTLNSKIVKQQQEIADAFYDAGLIEKDVKVSKIVMK